MKVISANLNGIRSAASKGFFDWMKRQKADVICIQETKAQEHRLSDKLFHPRGYHSFFYDAEKKGYSGTAIYSRTEPDQVHPHEPPQRRYRQSGNKELKREQTQFVFKRLDRFDAQPAGRTKIDQPGGWQREQDIKGP